MNYVYVCGRVHAYYCVSECEITLNVALCEITLNLFRVKSIHNYTIVHTLHEVDVLLSPSYDELGAASQSLLYTNI